MELVPIGRPAQALHAYPSPIGVRKENGHLAKHRPTLKLRSEEGRRTTVPITRNQAASSTNEGEEDTLQRLGLGNCILAGS
ncbi:hypothetical protein CR513_20249, partial [Mucuna pruriens]